MTFYAFLGGYYTRFICFLLGLYFAASPLRFQIWFAAT